MKDIGPVGWFLLACGFVAAVFALTWGIAALHDMYLEWRQDDQNDA